MTKSEVYVWAPGVLTLEDAALRCDDCVEGFREVQARSRCQDLEPVEVSIPCETCFGLGALEEIDCHGCGCVLAPTLEPVGAIVERIVEEPIFRHQRNGPTRDVAWYALLCGPCAWAECVCDAPELPRKERSSPAADRPIREA